MSRKTIRHGGVVKCDMPGCDETFTTYSVVTLARKQAALAGWARVKGSTVPGRDGYTLAMGGAEGGPVLGMQAKASDGRG